MRLERALESTPERVLLWFGELDISCLDELPLYRAMRRFHPERARCVAREAAAIGIPERSAP